MRHARVVHPYQDQRETRDPSASPDQGAVSSGFWKVEHVRPLKWYMFLELNLLFLSLSLFLFFFFFFSVIFLSFLFFSFFPSHFLFCDLCASRCWRRTHIMCLIAVTHMVSRWTSTWTLDALGQECTSFPWWSFSRWLCIPIRLSPSDFRRRSSSTANAKKTWCCKSRGGTCQKEPVSGVFLGEQGETGWVLLCFVWTWGWFNCSS